MTEKKSLEALNSWLRLAYQNADGTDEASAEVYEVLRTVFALITRQQLRIDELVGNNDKLNIELQSMRGAANSLKMHYEEAQAEINKLNAENMLTMSERNAFRNSFYEVSKQLKTAKSEAVKEFCKKRGIKYVENDI